MKYFDSHTHVQFRAFDSDCREVVKRALENGVGMLNVGTQKDTSRRAVELAREYDNLYASVGLHPIHTSESYHDKQELGIISDNGRANQHHALGGFISRAEDFDHDYYKNLTSDPKVVAIGECGLDYYRATSREKNETWKERQKEAFVKQIKLSHEVGKPLMIHCRQAFDDLIKILVSCRMYLLTPPGVIHFFSGTKDDAKRLLEMDFYFTFGGVITFVRDYDEVVKMVPPERILSETDAPYVAPIPYRGKRNEPLYVIEVVKKLAELKSVSEEEMRLQILKNAERVFGIKI